MNFALSEGFRGNGVRSVKMNRREFSSALLGATAFPVTFLTALGIWDSLLVVAASRGSVQRPRRIESSL